MKEKTFLVLVDALRHDFVDAERAPFLYSLKSSAMRATLVEPFTCDPNAAYLSGLEPKDSGACLAYDFSPHTSPYMFLKKLRPVCSALEILKFDRFFRAAIRRHAESLEKQRGRDVSSLSTATGFVPLTLLPYFSPRQRATGETIFDLLAIRGLRCTMVSSGGHFETSEVTAQKYASSAPGDFAFLQFSELAGIGRHYGPRSMPLTKALRRIDLALRRILEPALADGGNVIIFGNHGLVEVVNRVDLLAFLAPLPLRLGKDYVTYIDNTRAFFWFLQDRARAVLTQALANVPHGHTLSQDEIKKLSLSPQSSKSGELIFALNGGAVFRPSFTSSARSLPKGMHGYLPDVADNAAQLIARGPDFGPRDAGVQPMTQIYTLIREHLIPKAQRA